MTKNFKEIASCLVKEYYPNCAGALLAGSIVRREETETSDLDIVILDTNIEIAFRESFIFRDMPVEVFIHNEFTMREFFKSDAERARPSLPNMIVEGVVVRDCSLITDLKKEAAELLKNGPTPWNNIQIDFARYFITDLLEDFISCNNSNEFIFIAGALAEKAHEFYLRTNRQWIGQSKWIYRSLKNFDKEFADEFSITFDEFYKKREIEKVVQLIDRILEPFGGRLFDGFSLGKEFGSKHGNKVSI